MEPYQSLPIQVYVGYDSREPVAYSVCEHSIRKRTAAQVNIHALKHRDLRKAGHFSRPVLLESTTGDFVDLIDNKKSSTEFSHTRFLVPMLAGYKGWALFMDSDMIFLSDIRRLFALCDDRFAVMCVKHCHVPLFDAIKMDGREQLRYHRKNWSSFVLWNCSHPANAIVTKEYVGFAKGSDLHSFSWLKEELIGGIPYSYNYISGVSPKLPPQRGGIPDVIHYTEGGPWFDECKDVPYAGTWLSEFADWQENGKHVSNVPSMAYDKAEVIRK